jgi:uncharacterized alkaline shock family protein YloU
MTEQFTSDGLTIAPGVVETILAQSVAQVEGVAQVGAPRVADSILRGNKGNNFTQGILITAEDGQITVIVHLQVLYGYQIQDVATAVRASIAETLEGQIGVPVAAVDVFVDGVAFPH